VDEATSYTWTLPNGWIGSSTTNSIDVTAGANGGMVAVTANNDCGVSEASDLIVESFALPEVTFELDSDIICTSTGAFELTGGLPEGGVYSGPGVSDNIFSPATAGGGMHFITYTYTDVNICSQSAEQEIVVEVCTGITDSNNSSIVIYPNPFNNSLFIEFDANRERLIEFYNAVGQIVHSTNSTRMRVEVNSQHLTPGMYFIRISGEEKVIRVVKGY
jgi:hypothetical protein